MPVPISPLNGMVYSHYLRLTVLQWEEMPGAASYTVEVDCFHCCRYDAWRTDLGGGSKVIPGIKTTVYSFKFDGKQPGRWRVWAVTADRKEGPKSEWKQFTYTK
jgi:eukaryotic-like serine/threonine-protein kinase